MPNNEISSLIIKSYPNNPLYIKEIIREKVQNTNDVHEFEII